MPDWAYPLFFGLLAVWLGWTGLKDFQKGQAVMPRGGGTYYRETQPKMFWLATGITAFYAGMMGIAFFFVTQSAIQKHLIAACDAQDGKTRAFYRSLATACEAPLQSIWADDSTRETIYKNRAYALLSADQDDAAIEALTHAIAINPEDHWAFYARGEAYKDLGKPYKSVTDFEKALRLEPSDRNAMREIALARFDLAEPENAIAILNRLLALQPKDSNVILMLSAAYAMKGDCASARSWADKAMAMGGSVVSADEKIDDCIKQSASKDP